MNKPMNPHSASINNTATDELSLLDLLKVLTSHWKLLLASSFAVGVAAFCLTLLMPPQFTARTTFIPPQSSGAGLSAALSTLGPLAGLAGVGTTGAKGSGEMYVGLLQSEAIQDRIIDRFKLKELYKAEFQFETRDRLKSRSRIQFQKRDGFITIEVTDSDPQRAAQIANQYVEELRLMTAKMSLTDAQRRLAFFEEQTKLTKDRLTDAQNALQASGFNQGALRSEPKAAADEYGRLKAELTAAEIRLDALRSRLANSAPEVAQQTAAISAMRRQLQALEQKSDPRSSQDYVGRYREFKYQEMLFEQLSKQFEAARLEASNDDTSIQVVDEAQVPEWKSSPKRANIAVAAMLITLLLLSVLLIARHLRHLTRPQLQ